MVDVTQPPMDDVTAAAGSSARPSHRRRWIAIGLGVGAVVLVGGYAAAVASVSGDVPAGTSVRGVDIGGMSTEDATATLEAELGDAAAAPMPVTAGEASTELVPAESGLAVDWEATASQASGLILRPTKLVAHMRGEVELEPITTTDEAALASSLEALALVTAVEPVEPRIRYTKKGQARLKEGVEGTDLDVPASTELVSQAYFAAEPETVALPMQTVPTVIPADEAERVFTEFAEPAVALPVTLSVGAEAEKALVPPADIAKSLTFVPEEATLTPLLDGEELHGLLEDELSDIEEDGRSASFRIQNGKPVVVKSRKGRGVAPDDLGTAVQAVLPETTAAARVAPVELSAAAPDLTTKEARALNITEKLSSFFQDFAPANYRYVNVGEAARRINGTVLKPGELFSMNDTVGERTAANGFTEGFIISGGVFREELGGGVSIITTAMWTAGYYAGLERVEQHPHGLYISRYEAGLEATVAWGYLDLKMRNKTGNGVLITATRYNDGVLIEMWGTKKWDKVTADFSPRNNYTPYQKIYDDGDRCVPSSGSDGFSISVTRRRIIDGTSKSTETFNTVYKPTPNVICGPRP